MLQAKRYKAKINLRKPQKPHFERALLLTLTRPKFENKLKNKTALELCGFNEVKKVDIDNPYERFIATEILENFKASKLILFCHRNPMSSEETAEARRTFIKNNMLMEVYGKKTMNIALEGTPYESVLSFYISHNALVFSPETNVKKCLQICRKFTGLIPLGNNYNTMFDFFVLICLFLAAVLEGRFINKDELIYYSNIPNLETAQAGFVQTLNSIGGRVVNQLNAHQNTLLAHLEERIKQLEVK